MFNSSCQSVIPKARINKNNFLPSDEDFIPPMALLKLQGFSLPQTIFTVGAADGMLTLAGDE